MLWQQDWIKEEENNEKEPLADSLRCPGIFVFDDPSGDYYRYGFWRRKWHCLQPLLLFWWEFLQHTHWHGQESAENSFCDPYFCLQPLFLGL